MQFPVSIVQLSLLLPLFPNLIIATPAPAPISVPIPATTAYGNGPIKLPKISGGTALQGPDDITTAFYQYDDGAIHKLEGTGFPVDNEYQDEIVIKPGQVKYGSPLAVIDVSGIAVGDLRLYYVNSYNQLKEFVREPGKAWTTGALDDAGIYVKPDSQYLWAVKTYEDYSILVGYISSAGVLSVAGYNGEWSSVVV